MCLVTLRWKAGASVRAADHRGEGLGSVLRICNTLPRERGNVAG